MLEAGHACQLDLRRATPKLVNIVRLTRRSEFKEAAAHGVRWHAAPFQLQMVRGENRSAWGEAGVGFTATKRLGNAVVRNRARRRLREAVSLVMPDEACAGFNYVVIAKPAALTCAFIELTDELKRGFPAAARKMERARRSACSPTSLER